MYVYGLYGDGTTYVRSDDQKKAAAVAVEITSDRLLHVTTPPTPSHPTKVTQIFKPYPATHTGFIPTTDPPTHRVDVGAGTSDTGTYILFTSNCTPQSRSHKFPFCCSSPMIGH